MCQTTQTTLLINKVGYTTQVLLARIRLKKILVLYQTKEKNILMVQPRKLYQTENEQIVQTYILRMKNKLNQRKKISSLNIYMFLLQEITNHFVLFVVVVLVVNRIGPQCKSQQTAGTLLGLARPLNNIIIHVYKTIKCCLSKRRNMTPIKN